MFTASNANTSAASQMFELSTAWWRSCCLYTASRLDIADILANGPQTANAIAHATDCNPDAIYRLLRALASIDVFRENANHSFELTSLGATLTSNSPHSMKAWILAMLGERYIPWGELLYSVRTGRPSFTHVHGQPIWEYYNTHPLQNDNFVKAMEDHTRPVISNIIKAYDFSPYFLIADVGGGNGALLRHILDATPGSSGILFDQPAVIAAAGSFMQAPSIKNRCSLVPGNFFEAIPEKADCYVMKNILHDWNDDKALLILKTCAGTMKAQSRLLLLEAVIPDTNEPHPGKFMDINMLVVQGGRERTIPEFRQLASAAGLQYRQTIHTASPECSIVELVQQVP